ncbi:MAG: hypothetical protein ABIE23_00715 [archaeon]
MIDSFKALKDNPKLFLPKIFLALVWSVFLIYTGTLFIQLMEIREINLTTGNHALIQASLASLLQGLAVLLVLTIIFFLIDTIINASYPFMVKSYYRRERISFSESISMVLKNFSSIVLPIILAFLLSLAVLIPFILLFVFFFISQNALPAMISLLLLIIAAFITSVLVFFIYPVSALEKKGIGSIMHTIRIGRKHAKPVSLGVLIVFALSLTTLAIGFLGESIGLSSLIGFALFILLRIIVALISTYQMVLNPVLYLEYEKEMELK